MPRTGKSATSTGSGVYRQGDVPSHVFKIDPTKNPADMFYTDGGGTFANRFLTVNWTCLNCHTGRDVTWAKSTATTIHP